MIEWNNELYLFCFLFCKKYMNVKNEYKKDNMNINIFLFYKSE